MRYDWFRSYHGAPTDPKWLLIARKAGVPVHLVVAVVWALLDYASRNPDRGSIDGFDYETLSVFYGDSNESNEVSLRSVTQALQDKNIINSDLFFTKWEELQGDETHKPLTNSERQKLFRDKKKSQKEQENCKNSNENITGYNLNCNNNINNSNGIVTERNESNEYSNSVTQAVTKSNSVTTIEIEKEIENKKERKKESTASRAKTDFQKVYEAGSALFPNLATSQTAIIHKWLDNGCLPEMDIIPEIERHAKAKSPVRSWGFFTGGIMDEKTTRLTPLPPGTARYSQQPEQPKKSKVMNLVTGKMEDY